MSTNCIQCQKPLKDGSRFCTYCGTSQTIAETIRSNEPNCSCGHTNKSGQKFCTRCGKPLTAKTTESTSAKSASDRKGLDRETPPAENRPSLQKMAGSTGKQGIARKKIIIITSIFALAAIVLSVVWLMQRAPSGRLLFSAEIHPSDSNQLIQFSNQLSVGIPFGEIDKPSTIEVRETANLKSPDDNASIEQAYDITIRGKKSFEGYLDIRMPLPEGRPTEFSCLYYDARNKSWEAIPFEIDTKSRTASIATRHLSTFGLIRQDPTIVPGPAMKLGQTRFPSGRMMSYGNMLRTLNAYSTNNGVNEREANIEGWSTFTEWYGLTGAGLDLAEGALYVDDLADINGVLDNLGVGFAMAQAAVSLSEGDTAAAVFNAMKDMANYSIKNLIFDTRPMNIAMVGVFALDYSLNKFAEEAIAGRYEIYAKAYQLYYKEKEEREGINSVWWYKNLKRIARTGGNLNESKKALDDFFDSYFREYWANEETVALYQDKVSGQGWTGGGGLSEAVKMKISDAYKYEVRKSLEFVFKRIIREMRLEYLEKLHNQLEKTRKRLNERYPIDIRVKVDVSNPYMINAMFLEGKTVSFDVTNAVHKGKWNVRLNQKGEARLECTLIGFIHAGSPKSAFIRIPNPDKPSDSLKFSGEFVFSRRKPNKVEILIGAPSKEAIHGTWEITGVLESFEITNVSTQIGYPQPSQAQIDAAVNKLRQDAGGRGARLPNLEIQGLGINTDISAEGNQLVIKNAFSPFPSSYRVEMKGNAQFDGTYQDDNYYLTGEGFTITGKAKFRIKGKKIKEYESSF